MMTCRNIYSQSHEIWFNLSRTVGVGLKHLPKFQTYSYVSHRASGQLSSESDFTNLLYLKVYCDSESVNIYGTSDEHRTPPCQQSMPSYVPPCSPPNEVIFRKGSGQ